ncbi:MAG: hypothetical protein OXF05_01425 [Hyphomicrobiales bacterium]|nr:hypothetical protein [Hyphomicrobiales bacterium]MCY4033783.1 hypothetical protein [Hyphomicrobiales bacterium]MCY4039418.1 hypothetical protein [Hyphomicrobiales bacterium]
MTIDYSQSGAPETVDAYLVSLRARVENILSDLDARGVTGKHKGKDIDMDAIQEQLSEDEREQLDNFQTEIKRIFADAENIDPSQLHHQSPRSPRHNLRAI